MGTRNWNKFGICSSVAKLCLILHDPMDCSTPGSSVLHSLLEFTQTYVHGAVMLSNHLIFWDPCLPLPSIFPSIRVLSTEWPSSAYSGLISFRINWFDLLSVQGILKSLFQKHRSKASVLSLLYGSILTSVHDYWKNHSFDYTDHCQSSDISAF